MCTFSLLMRLCPHVSKARDSLHCAVTYWHARLMEDVERMLWVSGEAAWLKMMDGNGRRLKRSRTSEESTRLERTCVEEPAC